MDTLIFLVTSAIFFTLLLFCSLLAFAQWRLRKDKVILWYIGYLLGTFAHYWRQFWIIGVQESGFINLPDPPLEWGTPMSYAAFACYFLFLERLMDIRTSAVGLSRILIISSGCFVWMIGVNLLLQCFGWDEIADKVHQAFQVLLLPTMMWILVHLIRNARLFYQKLVLIGTIALIIGFVCVICTHVFNGRYDLLRTVICCFPTPWRDICIYHLKVGIAIDVLCFSWALTLRQKMLLQAVLPPILPAIILPYVPPPDDTFLTQVEYFLSNNFQNEKLSVEQVAQAVFLSAGQTNRKLKEKTGMTTEQKILRYRLERALEVLHGTEMPIGEIVFAVGMKDIAYFSHVFKKQYGVSPSEIRKKAKVKADKTQKNAG